MSIPPQSLPLPQWAYVPGETAEVAADYETLAQAKLLLPLRFGGYAGAASRAALRHRAQRPRLFLGSAGDLGDRLGGSTAGRTRAHPAARLHPHCLCQFEAPHAEAERRGAVFRRGAG